MVSVLAADWQQEPCRAFLLLSSEESTAQSCLRIAKQTSQPTDHLSILTSKSDTNVSDRVSEKLAIGIQFEVWRRDRGGFIGY